MKLQLVGESGKDRYSDNSSQLTQNLYIHTAKGGKSKMALYPTPGLTQFADIGTGPIRGEINYNGTYFIVSGNEFYEVDAAGSSTLRGTLNTSYGRCGLDHNGANNGKQICIVDGTNGYIYNSLYQTFASIAQKSASNADTNTLNKLEDSGATFSTDGVVAGMVVYNTTDSTQGTVSEVDSETVLTIVNSAGTVVDLFPLGTEAYEVGSDGFPDGATHCEFFDGYFLWNDPTNSGRFFKSKGYDGTDIDILEYATAERSPDELQGLIKTDKLLWLVGTETAEPWFNAGAPDFPFEAVGSGFSEWGTVAKYSIVQTSGMAFWISQNKEGNGLVIMVDGFTPRIISTPEIAAEIALISDISDCYSFVYQAYQHTFVVFTFPSGGKTIVYDTTEQKFHTWKSKNLDYHRSTGHTFVYNKHLVGDPITGKIYELDYDNYTDNGDCIERKRISAVFHADERGLDWEVIGIDIKEGVDLVNSGNNITATVYSGTAFSIFVGVVADIGVNFIDERVIAGDTYTDIDSGISSEILIVGNQILNLVTTGFIGTSYTITRNIAEKREAQLHLRWREENGKWSNYHSRSMGKIGERNKKLRWRQTGYTGSSRVFEVTCTDPVPVVILDAYARVKLDDVEMS